jgi:hypothetical protein
MRGWLLAGSMALGLGGCSSLLEVDVPSQIPADETLQPENAPLLMNSVIGEFECAFGDAVVLGALLGDELSNSSSGNTLWQIDRRDMAPGAPIGTGTCPLGGPFSTLSVSRWLADEFLRLLDGWTDAQVADRKAFIAATAAYAGYSYLLLGELQCTATVDVGPELTKAQLFALAEEKFTRAITEAQGGAADILNMALVGRARARQDLVNRAGAAADARLVPIGFVKNATYSAVDPRRENQVFDDNNQGGFMTVGPVFRDFKFAGVPDPRVPVVDAGRNGQFGPERLWLQLKYTDKASSIPIATWEEAQLIIAESELEAGHLQAAVDIINLLHSRTTPALPSFASTDAAEIRSQLIYERRAELFLESQLLYDNLRFNLPFVPAPGTAFPVGGGFYGNQRCFFLPDLERSTNPNTSLAR